MIVVTGSVTAGKIPWTRSADRVLNTSIARARSRDPSRTPCTAASSTIEIYDAKKMEDL